MLAADLIKMRSFERNTRGVAPTTRRHVRADRHGRISRSQRLFCDTPIEVRSALVRSSFRDPHPVDMEPFVLVGYKKIFDEAYFELMEERGDHPTSSK